MFGFGEISDIIPKGRNLVFRDIEYYLNYAMENSNFFKKYEVSFFLIKELFFIKKIPVTLKYE